MAGGWEFGNGDMAGQNTGATGTGFVPGAGDLPSIFVPTDTDTSPDNLDTAFYRAGGRLGTDHLMVQVSDGEAWSDWTRFDIRTLGHNPGAPAPELSFGVTGDVPVALSYLEPVCDIPLPEEPVSGLDYSAAVMPLSEIEWVFLMPDTLFV